MSCSTCGSHGYICQQPIRHCFVLLFQCPHLEKSLCTLGTPRIGFPTLNWLTYLSLFFLFLLRLRALPHEWQWQRMEGFNWPRRGWPYPTAGRPAGGWLVGSPAGWGQRHFKLPGHSAWMSVVSSGRRPKGPPRRCHLDPSDRPHLPTCLILCAWQSLNHAGLLAVQRGATSSKLTARRGTAPRVVASLHRAWRGLHRPTAPPSLQAGYWCRPCGMGLSVVTLQWHGTFMEYSHSRKDGVLLKWVLTKWTSQSRFIKGLNTPWTMKLSHGLVRALSGYWIRPRITLVNIKGNMSKSDHGGRGVQKTYFKVYIITRRSLHCQVEHHVQTKFATPILHAIDNFNIYGIFLYIYITIDSIFCIFVFWNFSHLHFFVVIFLVQFCFILARNGMFYNKKRIIKFSYHSLLCNRYRVYLLMTRKNW